DAPRMKRHTTWALLLLAATVSTGCHGTKSHLHCWLNACHYPYSCPPCPYYDKHTHAWHRPGEIYTGVPTPTLVSAHPVAVKPETPVSEYLKETDDPISP